MIAVLRPHRSMWLAALLAGLGMPACQAPPIDHAAVEAAIAEHVGRGRDWGAGPIASELRELADALPRGGGEPAHIAVPLHVGEDALAARLHLIRSARRTVDLQVYVWADDMAGGLVLRELLLAARRGVRVRVLVDQLAVRSRDLGAGLALAHENLAFQFYNPVQEFTAMSGLDLARDALRRFDGLNERMHNKVLVVDGELAVVGGRNIADDYFDLDPDFLYLDRDLLVAGPVVAAVQASFDAYWDAPISVPAAQLPGVARDVLAFARAPHELDYDRPFLAELAWMVERAGLRPLEWVLPHSRLHRVGRVEFDADPPVKEARYDWSTSMDRAGPAQEAFEQARRRVLLQSNYLLLSPSTQANLAGLLERALEVQYLTNSFASTANLLTYSASRKRKRYLLTSGLDVRELRPDPRDVRHFVPRFDALARRDDEGRVRSVPQVAIHAKSAVIDDDVALIGSHNLDPRSRAYNTEAWFVVWDEGVAREVAGELELAAGDGNSWICHTTERIPVWDDVNAVLAGASRALPVLDVWPWFGYSMYELRPGARPVAVDAPEFYERYRRVGELPGEGSRWKRVKTRLLTTVIAPFKQLL